MISIKQDSHLILGPPGTGKTSYLLDAVERALSAGVASDRIVFVSFTKAAVCEARDRAAEKFSLTPKDFPWFRTLHSLCYKALGLNYSQMFGPGYAVDFGKKIGQYIDVSSVASSSSALGVGGTNALGTVMLHIDNLARTKQVSLREAWQFSGNTNVPFLKQEQFSGDFLRFKEARGLYDYTDVLQRYAKNPVAIMEPAYIILVDEAQDLSSLQWEVIDRLVKHASIVFIAGDDDQAIYEWSGADIDTFLNLRTTTKEVLKASYRLPYFVWYLANKISQRITKRYAKQWHSKKLFAGHSYGEQNDEGGVEHVAGLNRVSELLRSGNWLVLARNHCFLDDMRHICETSGYAYDYRDNSGERSERRKHLQAIFSWEKLRKGMRLSPKAIREIYSLMRVGKEVARGSKQCPDMEDDKRYSLNECCLSHGLKTTEPWYTALARLEDSEREYYRALLAKEGETLSGEPRIILSTIHQAKGMEADNVLLLLDMSPRTAKGMEVSPDAEHRVWYVGVSRAKEKLWLLEPQTVNSYPIERM